MYVRSNHVQMYMCYIGLLFFVYITEGLHAVNWHYLPWFKPHTIQIIICMLHMQCLFMGSGQRRINNGVLKLLRKRTSVTPVQFKKHGGRVWPTASTRWCPTCKHVAGQLIKPTKHDYVEDFRPVISHVWVLILDIFKQNYHWPSHRSFTLFRPSSVGICCA